MTLLRMSVHVEDGYIIVRLNDMCIAENTGVWEREIDPGSTYIIQWFVNGRKGSSYSVTISNPNEAEFHLTRTIGQTEKDFGGLHFSI